MSDQTSSHGPGLSLDEVVRLIRKFHEPWRAFGRQYDCGFMPSEYLAEDRIYVIATEIDPKNKPKRSVVVHPIMHAKLLKMRDEIPFRPRMTDEELATMIAFYAETQL